MLKNRTLMSLIGVFVVAALAWLLLNLWYLPAVGKFSCSYSPWFLGAGYARADTHDHACPDSIQEAADDASWAADRLAEINDAYRTTGLYYDSTGARTKILSGDPSGADAERASAILRAAGVRTAPDGSYPVARHVEVKVAAIMRQRDERRGVLIINYEGGPCGPYDIGRGCRDVLALVLAPSATLRVWYPSNGGVQYDDFSGQ